VLERGEHYARRKPIYEQLHPEAATHGGDRRSKRNDFVLNSFADDTAAKTGVTPRTVQQEVQIATNLLPEVKELVRDTPFADSKTDLLALSRLKPEEQKAVAERLKTEPGSVKDVTRRMKHEERIERFGDSEPLTGTGYQVVYADPPWQYDFSKDSADTIEAHYPTMPLEEIRLLPVGEIATRDSVLFLWATSPKLKEAMQVIDTWGFTYRTCAVWVKNWIGMGYYFRQRHELLLVATRGEPPTPFVENRPDSVQESPKEEHSKKPDLFYTLIEAMYPQAKRIELFARQVRLGWDQWGNEV
jgi:N6-adenosine-specific RNA methylase IME4